MRRIVIRGNKKLVHTIIGIGAGWRHEEPGIRGITHFLEHAIFLGNRIYPEPDEEARKFGVELEGMTLPEYTLFYFTSLEEDFNKIFSMFLSLIFHPEFNPDKLQREKEESILTAIVQESDYTPWELGYAWAENLLFDWDFRLSLGTEEDIRTIHVNDLVDWHSKYYNSSNGFVMVYGNIEESEVAQSIEKAKISVGKQVPIPFKARWGEREKVIYREDTKNIEMIYGFKIPDYDIGWEVFNLMIGSSHPIAKEWEVRRKYCYTTETNLEWTKGGEGGLFLYFGANSLRNSEEIDKSLFSVLKGMKIKEEEVEKAKKMLSIEILKMKEGGERGFFKFFKFNHLLRYRDFDEILPEIENVTKDKILKLKDLLIQEKPVKVKVGNIK
jgi:predicted Zn-dependent peptidase